jgi:hypothetical protein
LALLLDHDGGISQLKNQITNFFLGSAINELRIGEHPLCDERLRGKFGRELLSPLGTGLWNVCE